MKTTATMLASAMLATAGCGGSDSTADGAAQPATELVTTGSSDGDTCVPFERCDPERRRFCERPPGACYLLYPGNRAVPISCESRPRPAPTQPPRYCP